MLIPSDALNQHIAVLGKTGSGKTYAAKGIVERLLREHRQTCVIDPTGAWWGLRLAADGKGKGFDVVLLGGEHADIPLAERSGPAVARLVTEQGASVVIDTSGFHTGQYTRWFIDFAENLYTTLRNPLHLVIDEAHYFAPQQGGFKDVDSNKMLHTCNRLMSGGRSRGVRAMLITQRPSKLHKDSLTCADTLIAMRVIGPQDRQAIKDWIDGAGDPVQGKTVLDSLAQLQRGEGWVWYPEGKHLKRVMFPVIATYDSSAAPKHGAKSSPKVGEIDLAEVQTALAEAVKEAEANDPKLLRKEIAELKKQLGARPKETVEKVVEKIVEVPVLNNGLLDRTDKIIDRLAKKADELTTETGKVQAELAELRRLIAPAFPMKVPSGPTWTPTRVKQFNELKVKPTPKPQPQHVAESTVELTGPQQAILDTVLMLNTRGINANRESVARWLGIHPNGGSYGSNLGRLRADGYLDGFRLTDTGSAAAREQETGFDALLAALDEEPKRKILRTLANAGRAMSRDEMAAELGIHPNGGSYGSNLGWLRTMGVITERGPIELTEGATR